MDGVFIYYNNQRFVFIDKEIRVAIYIELVDLEVYIAFFLAIYMYDKSVYRNFRKTVVYYIGLEMG